MIPVTSGSRSAPTLNLQLLLFYNQIYFANNIHTLRGIHNHNSNLIASNIQFVGSKIPNLAQVLKLIILQNEAQTPFYINDTSNHSRSVPEQTTIASVVQSIYVANSIRTLRCIHNHNSNSIASNVRL